MEKISAQEQPSIRGQRYERPRLAVIGTVQELTLGCDKQLGPNGRVHVPRPGYRVPVAIALLALV